jgi:hypothetical protein
VKRQCQQRQPAHARSPAARTRSRALTTSAAGIASTAAQPSGAMTGSGGKSGSPSWQPTRSARSAGSAPTSPSRSGSHGRWITSSRSACGPICGSSGATCRARAGRAIGGRALRRMEGLDADRRSGPWPKVDVEQSLCINRWYGGSFLYNLSLGDRRVVAHKNPQVLGVGVWSRWLQVYGSQ